MDILAKIISNKLKEIAVTKAKIPLEVLKADIKKAPKTRSFKKAISKRNKLCIIGEIKKASPSAGIIRKSFNPVDLALCLEKCGVDALSVLTDKKFFKGELSYIKKIKARSGLPVLRKDFIIDEYQVYESRANAADSILLIAGILSKGKLKKLYSLARRLKMDCLIEVNSRQELKNVLKINPDIVGINNRNLKDFTIDFKISRQLRPLIPRGVIAISESGVKGICDIQFIKSLRFNACLIGEALMRKLDREKICAKRKNL